MLIGWARLYLAGFPLQTLTDFEKEFQKRNASEFDLNAVVSSQRERKSTWSKAQSSGGKPKGIFLTKNVYDLQTAQKVLHQWYYD